VWTTNVYEGLGRTISVTTPDGAVVTSSYSANNTKVTDQAGKLRRSLTDAAGRLIRVDEPDGGGNLGAVASPAQPTYYSYDVLDNLTGVTQGTQPARSFVYDSLKRLTSASNPESGVVGYEYDNNGNLFRKTDSRTPAVVTTYFYDALNRVTKRTYTDSTPEVNYYYDNQTLPAGAPGFTRGPSIGRLVAVTYGGATSSAGTYQGYDASGRPAASFQKTDAQIYQLSYGYDLAGNIRSQTYPSGKEIRTSYDSAGRLSGVSRYINSIFDKTYASQMSYASHGAVKQVQLGNQKWEHTLFNSRLQPTEIGIGINSSDSSLMKLEYTYGNPNPSIHDNNGNVLTQQITAPKNGGTLILTQSYGYDSLNRLQSASENGTPGWSEQFSYDRWGNMWVSGYSGITINMTTPQSQSAFDQSKNRFSQTTFPNVLYDGAGNMKRDAVASTFNYDGENRQTKSTVGAVIADYYYDGDGHRIKKVVGTVTTIYVYNVMGQLAAEYTNDPVPPPAGGGGTSYLTLDQLGSTRVVTKTDGSVKARYDYLPFGDELASSLGGRGSVSGYGGADSTKQKFASKERDGESGLDYFLSRYYSGAQGRFTSSDSYLIIFEKEKGKDDAESTRILEGYIRQPQVWNKYVYTLNNPLKYTDPDGRRALTPEDLKFFYILFVEMEKARKAGQTDLANAIDHAYRDIVAAIQAVPQGQEDPARLRAVFYAINHLGDPRYASDGTGSELYINSNGWRVTAIKSANKCNFFVAAAYALGGGIGFTGNGNTVGIPVSGRGPFGIGGLLWGVGTVPSANTWAAGSVQNFTSVSSPEVGDVAAWKGSGAGHSGIYIGGGASIYAGPKNVKVQTIDFVNRDQAQHGGGSVSYKRYKP
jgi:RHS repeat-associated protein